MLFAELFPQAENQMVFDEENLLAGNLNKS